MFRNKLAFFLAAGYLLVSLLAAGCGGGGGQRIMGLSPSDTVKTFFDAAKNNQMSAAALYVSPSSANAQAALNYMSGQNNLSNLQNYNLLSLNKVAEQGNFSVVVATLQEQNSTKFTVKPVGLEKINGEWYIVDNNQIYSAAKYSILAQLLSKIQ
ncbi:Hypothetical protein LUCI_3625 [Lucifera butyrica]|uniref:DUF4878 domain-containing protein n=1 Tax=Lucifera butyrica TaxID=1351585 RepID=A0A498RE49_9FIRM|nr:hypothetical protein [Lucifera butyrica]VBB08353.1 Hypothetical protein LUCI_3625 [Lucifera butyrica]